MYYTAGKGLLLLHTPTCTCNPVSRAQHHTWNHDNQHNHKTKQRKNNMEVSKDKTGRSNAWGIGLKKERRIT